MNFNILIAGPPGCGKKCAVRAAAAMSNLKVTGMELSSWHPAALNKMARTMPSGTILCNDGAEPAVCMLIGLDICMPGKDYEEAIRTIRRQRNVVGICNDPTIFKGFYGCDLLRVRGFTWAGLASIINKLPGSEVLSGVDRTVLCRAEGLTNGNARRVKLAGETLIMAKQLGHTVDGAVDCHPHPYFTTVRLLNRERLDSMPSGKVDIEWVRTNLVTNLGLEDAARAASLVAIVDTLARDHDDVPEMLLAFARSTPAAWMISPKTPLQRPLCQTDQGLMKHVYTYDPSMAAKSGHDKNRAKRAYNGNGVDSEEARDEERRAKRFRGNVEDDGEPSAHNQPSSSSGSQGFSVGPPGMPASQLALGVPAAAALRHDVLAPSTVAEGMLQGTEKGR